VGGGFPERAGGLLSGFSAGSRVAGYRLEEQVGADGMAVVFRALDERLGRQAALKILAHLGASSRLGAKGHSLPVCRLPEENIRR